MIAMSMFLYITEVCVNALNIDWAMYTFTALRECGFDESSLEDVIKYTKAYTSLLADMTIER